MAEGQRGCHLDAGLIVAKIDGLEVLVPAVPAGEVCAKFQKAEPIAWINP